MRELCTSFSIGRLPRLSRQISKSRGCGRRRFRTRVVVGPVNAESLKNEIYAPLIIRNPSITNQRDPNEIATMRAILTSSI
jgi:hypothetical protein